MSRGKTISKEQFIAGMKNMKKCLNDMGYSELRPGQAEPISALLSGRDTVCILSTGAGKTLTFQLPTMMMGWKTIVFSPLIALMKDQVHNACRLGIRAASCTSTFSEGINNVTLRSWQKGDIDMLWVAPERINNPMLKAAMEAVHPDMIVVDEAHCLSQWGHNFRPSYVRVKEFINEFKPTVVGAFTATATQSVLDDIVDTLQLENPFIHRYYPVRSNLKLSASECNHSELQWKVLKMLKARPGNAIVYCQTVREVEDMFSFLVQAGIEATYYHAQITPVSVKDRNQEAFMSGRARVCVATNAFGMGIDKPDIETVIHCGPPGSVEAVAQETGRAARDGRDAVCHMFITGHTIATQEIFWDRSNPDGSTLQQVYAYLESVADATGECRVLGQDLNDHLGQLPGIDGAMAFLTTHGCIERYSGTGTTMKVLIKTTEGELSTARKSLLEHIMQYGNIIETSNEGILYEIDKDYLVEKYGRSEQTIKQHLYQMEKDGFVFRPTVFRGKLTKLLHAPTKEMCKQADEKRAEEYKKLLLVREYAKTDDNDKHNFLQKHFALA